MQIVYQTLTASALAAPTDAPSIGQHIAMKLIHFRLCPFSRAIRLALSELELDIALVEEKPWDVQPAFLAINPAGDTPVLELPGNFVLCGAYSICEFLGEEAAAAEVDARATVLFPGSTQDRAEIRRLVDWFHGKFNREVTHGLLAEKVYSRYADPSAHAHGGAPNVDLLRHLRSNMRYHLSYISFLIDQRRWLGGDELSYCDLAAAAHLSVVDYLGEVPWDDYPIAKSWYVRLKSRRSFQTLLTDRLPGLPPPFAYADLDF
jgi:glutathione S-transferase